MDSSSNRMAEGVVYSALGIRLALDMGMRSVVFKGECKAIATTLKSTMEHLNWDTRSMLLDCKSLLKQLDV
ncbi:hypothetical protein PanWU01x14_276970 [Parasponia andersonii]|uniref:RNase H type-1 domain-containing protein n=1 Tax=Parasponia andersonii TaxID=3476 RepID=A0A2P5B2N6_PARAD|nr:hypothetical protein PanWU01x14_276970 [Parasponia andersonii]